MTEKKEWVVATTPDRPFAEIEKDLIKAGASVARDEHGVPKRYEHAGVLYVEADDSLVQKVRAVPGVADVSPEGPPVHAW